MDRAKERCIDDEVRTEIAARDISEFSADIKTIIFDERENIFLELSPYQKYFVSIMANRKSSQENNNQ